MRASIRFPGSLCRCKWLAAALAAPVLLVPLMAEQDLDAIFQATPSGTTANSTSETWGTLNFAPAPWINTNTLGFFYLEPSGTPDGYYLWSEMVGWIYSSAQLFPQAYLFTFNSWALFDFSDPSVLKFFTMGDRKWHLLQKPGIQFNAGARSVPGDLVGYYQNYTLSGSSVHTDTISIGSTGLRIAHKVVSWMVGYLKTYSYSAMDGRFYPVSKLNTGGLWAPDSTTMEVKIPDASYIYGVELQPDGSTLLYFGHQLDGRTWTEVLDNYP